VVLLALLTGLSCSATDRKPSTGTVGAEGWHELNLQHDGLKRWFRVYHPPDLPPGAAVVVLLHGGGQSMRRIFRPRSGGT
jgi:poly(3-hydroxybutyrate) depolymerase